MADRHKFRFMMTKKSSSPLEETMWKAEDGWHIDVRGLAPPNPMVAIIKLLEMPDAGSRVVVHHEREPFFLYPELAERGWRWRLMQADPGEVRIELRRE